jgi:signal recognition particle receptor subunit beta
MSEPTHEVVGRLEDGARAIIQSVLEVVGSDVPSDAADAASNKFLEDALLPAVVAAMKLELARRVPFEKTANLMASILSYVAATNLRLTSLSKGIQ